MKSDSSDLSETPLPVNIYPVEKTATLDQEWQARHGYEKKPKRKRSMHWGKLIAVLVLIVLNLMIGVAGGVTGFVMLSNSDTSLARSLRSALNLTNSTVTVPVRQSVTVEESSKLIESAQKVSPAVVSIIASAQYADFFGRVSTQEVGGGTGFIITSDGLIITNKHVVNENATYKVILNDSRSFDATVKAKDTSNDLAVLKIEAKDLPTVELGSSDALQPGQYVLAIGNALGEYKNSVTMGVVSAKDRSVTVSGTETLTDLIQTDAAINPGNSGGPLVNLEGQVVGINTVIASQSGGSEGIGFAIAIDSIKNVIDTVRRTGEIIRPYLGVRYIAVNKSVQSLNSLTVDYGALIARGNTINQVAVIPGSPADKAGLVEGDIILEINGQRIDESNPISKYLQKYNVGDSIPLKILSKGTEKTVTVKLERMPS